ncbi:MAG TPA: lycopene cyclase domain-containing protein, partial [Chitinophaga sp.]|uniref:lycopene cyclase domain-containing protein n=1 Tax=Chitinophaga sp. TaxID=1869181 RepID=UPI002F95CDF7
YIYNLPVEEALFFVCIPYACLFSYHCIKVLWLKQRSYRQLSNIISGIIIVLLAAAIFFFHNKAYPLVTAVLLMAFVLYNAYVKKQAWMGALYISYGVMLLPFLIVNGLLTGSWIPAPVVWYNSAEIIGTRILTIPVEDVFYGLLMVGLNTLVYEYLLNRHTVT